MIADAPPPPDRDPAPVPDWGRGSAETGRRMEVGRSAALVWVSGEVDTLSADELYTALEQQATSTPDRVMVDLSGVTFMDSVGLRALVAASQLAPIQVVHPSDTVAALLYVTGLEDTFGV
ncbi:MAG: STAS domain-containing protein [Actinomycetes bacterium]